MGLRPFDFAVRTRIVFGDGMFAQLGSLARELGFTRTLIVADQGIVSAGYVDRATTLLTAAGISVDCFGQFEPNPDANMVNVGVAAASAFGADSIVAIGGGSSLDCAKGINFVLTNGGPMSNYWGYGKATQPMLPAIGVPTTTGTGSEAQSYALISDPVTHRKMACGDPKVAFRIAVLDPLLSASQPRSIAAVAGYDALAHAVETYVSTRRNEISDLFARSAWRRLVGSYERIVEAPGDVVASGAMLLGAHEAGIAIEHSMLGATHACANALTALHGTTHGIAIAVMLPHVVRWNGAHVDGRYAHLAQPSNGRPSADAGDILAARLEALSRAGGLPATLRELGVERDALPALVADATTQWTGTFNPRPFDATGAQELFERAY